MLLPAVLRSDRQAFRSSGAKTVVFDGDAYATDSFTALVPQLAPPGSDVQVAAVILPRTHGGELPPARQQQFERSWAVRLLSHTPSRMCHVQRAACDVLRIEQGLGLDITAFVLPLDLELAGDDYVALGTVALSHTEAELVFCLGGGACVAAECNRIWAERHSTSRLARFNVFPVARWQPIGSGQNKVTHLEACHLLRTGDNVKIFQLLPKHGTLQRACAGCGKTGSKDEFSATQWRKGAGVSRCMECCAAAGGTNSSSGRSAGGRGGDRGSKRGRGRGSNRGG
eukprot:SAG31_NODE_9007_length_1331_cov_1.024800_1_plen_283_part_10